MPQEKKTAPFVHPVLGESDRDPRYLAIWWRGGATAEAKAALLRSAGLELAITEGKEQPPQLRVNQTLGLSWVQSKGAKNIPDDTIPRLEASEAVEWVAPAFRSKQDGASLYAVNPTRLYVKESELDNGPGAAALAGASPDADRPSGIPGYVALAVGDAKFQSGRTSLDVVTALSQALTTAGRATSSAVKVETIPFFSPTCCACGGSSKHGSSTPSCKPPTSEFTPNDPRFGIQWGLQRIGVPRAWEIARGSPSVTVAVIDEGVELGHPDLDLHPQSWNASTDTPDGSPTGNHGTACAGIIGARFNNSLGVAGVAAGVKVMAIATATWADIDIAEGLYFAADHGARVVSMSFGVYPSWMTWDFDLIRDALQHAQDHGLVLVAASGNENWNQSRFPGSDARTLCVGGSNRSDERKRIGDSSSEAWWGASYGPDVDVVAPCLEIPTTDRLAGDGYDAGDYYDRFNGTSAATPHVAGLAALAVSLRPSLTNVDVRRLIESTCEKISPALYTYSNVGSKPSGTWNEEVGYGRVNAERALLAACATAAGEEGDCSGCGGDCIEPTPDKCRGPKPVPWLPYDRCLYFYEVREFAIDPNQDRRIRLRVTYEHCLSLQGRQQGGLLYTTTLLPGEEVKLYEYDRFRRVRSETERVSVHTSFRQTMSALSQNCRTTRTSAYFDTLTDIRAHADTSVAAGGGLAGFLGAPTVKSEFETDTETTIASGGSASTVSDQFTQFAITASQSTEAERSVVVSCFEDEEHRSATSRVFKNTNHCFAVTYFVRRVNEVYEASTRVELIEWRIGDNPWRAANDLEGLSDALRKFVEEQIRRAPKPGTMVRDRRQITLATDGTLYEAELAHCSSCEPVREAEERIKLEQLRINARRACLETELLALELERRQSLARSANPAALDVGRWPLDREAEVEMASDSEDH